MHKSRIHTLLVSAASVAAASAVLAFSASPAFADFVWTGTDGSGSWTDGTNWSGTAPSGTVPANVFIGQGSPAVTTVTYNVGATTGVTLGSISTGIAGGMQISSGYTLTATASEGLLGLDLPAQYVTNITGGGNGLNNAGTINFAGAHATTWTLNLGYKSGEALSYSNANSGIIESTNGGALTLSQSTNAVLENAGGLIQTTNASTLFFQGAAQIVGGTITNGTGSTMGNNVLANNKWTLNGVAANNNGTWTESQNPGAAGMYSTAQFLVNATTFTNSTTGTVTFAQQGPAPAGTVSLVVGPGVAATSYFITATPGTSDTSTLTNSGKLNIQDTSTVSSGSTSGGQLCLNTTSATTNNGTIAFSTTSAGGETTSINLGQDSTINGTGLVTFTGPANSNYVETMYSLSTSSHPTLTIGSGQTFQGSFNLGYGSTAGTYTFGSLMINNQGTLHANVPGNPININTYNNNSFINSGSLSVDNNAQINDSDTALTFTGGNTHTTGLLDVIGALTLSSGSGTTLSVSDVGSTVLANGTSFTLIETGSAISGTFGGYAEGSLYTVGLNTYDVSYEGDDVTFTVTSTPEPASCTLLALGGLGLLKRRRWARGDCLSLQSILI